jgi:hypothetical protein
LAVTESSVQDELESNLLNGTPLRESLPQNALESRVDRQLYRPPNPAWSKEEEALLQTLARENDAAAATVEPEPPGVDGLLVVAVGGSAFFKI